MKAANKTKRTETTVKPSKTASDAGRGRYFVLNEDRVIYRADSIGEGLAFIDGRGDGVLCRMLTAPQDDAPKTNQRSATGKPAAALS